jgi:hypothetical protein
VSRRPGAAAPGALVRSLLAATLLITGCACTPSTDATAQGAASEIRVGLTEWAIQTGDVLAAPGELTMVVTNTGATRHDLVVDGRAGTWRTPMLDPGERHHLTVRAEAGEQLRLTCTVTGHHAQGMHAELPVHSADESDQGAGATDRAS